MRWIFYTLLVINLGYFAWSLAEPWRATAKAPVQSLPPERADGRDIQLLDEARDAALRYSPQVAAPDPKVDRPVDKPPEGSVGVTDQQTPAEGARCAVFGPLMDERVSLRLISELRERQVAARLEKEALSSTMSYWVYLPPFASQQQALTMIGRLRQNDIQSFLITEGALRTGLSLGVYQDAEVLEGLIARLQGMGLSPEVVNKSQRYYIYQVLVPMVQGQIPIAEILSEVQQQYPQMQYRQKVCKSVASGG